MSDQTTLPLGASARDVAENDLYATIRRLTRERDAAQTEVASVRITLDTVARRHEQTEAKLGKLRAIFLGLIDAAVELFDFWVEKCDNDYHRQDAERLSVLITRAKAEISFDEVPSPLARKGTTNGKP